MQSESFTCKTIDELEIVSGEIIDRISHFKVVAVYGVMGAGKTTLIKAICKKLGVTDTMSSPTFSIVNEYQTANDSVIYHFDFYRINSEEEALDFGYENYFFSGNLCLIEWPEKIPNLLNLPHLKIMLSVNNEIRNINLEY